MSTASIAREWLKDAGYQVSEKGRIPADLMSQYLAHVNERGHRTSEGDSIKKASGSTNKKGWTCGFCTPTYGQPRGCKDEHRRCPGSVRRGSSIGGGESHCRCSLAGHPESWPLAWPKVDE